LAWVVGYSKENNKFYSNIEGQNLLWFW